MTPRVFRHQHGDPTRWDATDIDSYLNLTETTRRHRLALRIACLQRRLTALRRSLHLAA